MRDIQYGLTNSQIAPQQQSYQSYLSTLAYRGPRVESAPKVLPQSPNPIFGYPKSLGILRDFLVQTPLGDLQDNRQEKDGNPSHIGGR